MCAVALSDGSHGDDASIGVCFAQMVAEPVGESSPLHLCWPGAPPPSLTSSPSSRMFQGCGGVMGHKVPHDTDTPHSG